MTAERVTSFRELQKRSTDGTNQGVARPAWVRIGTDASFAARPLSSGSASHSTPPDASHACVDLGCVHRCSIPYSPIAPRDRYGKVEGSQGWQTLQIRECVDRLEELLMWVQRRAANNKIAIPWRSGAAGDGQKDGHTPFPALQTVPLR